MKKKKYVILFARPPYAGFLSILNQILGWLYYCERHNMEPVVYLNKNCRYWVDEGHNGKRNAWEYYFEPTSKTKIMDLLDIDLGILEDVEIWEFEEALLDSPPPQHFPKESLRTIPVPENVLITDKIVPRISDSIYDVFMVSRKMLQKLYQRYIILDPEVIQKTESFYNAKMRGFNVLGIHKRGIEHSDERVYFGNDGYFDTSYDFREIDLYLKKYPKSKIFVATDSKRILKEFKEKYPEKVIHYEVNRLREEEEAVGLHRRSPEAYSKAKLIEEVMIDTLLLSKCDYLICEISNITLIARTINPTLNNVNIYYKYAGLKGKAYFLLRKINYMLPIDLKELLVGKKLKEKIKSWLIG